VAKRSKSWRFWNGLLAPDHREAIGIAVWEFLWCIDRTTKEADGVGLVLGGKEVSAKMISDDLGITDRTVRANLKKLERAGYVTLRQGKHGYLITVPKSKKWTSQERKEVAGLGPQGRKKASGLEEPRAEGSFPESGRKLPLSNIMKLTVVDSTNHGVNKLCKIFNVIMAREPTTAAQRARKEYPVIMHDLQTLIDRVGQDEAERLMTDVCTKAARESRVLRSINNALVQIDIDEQRENVSRSHINPATLEPL